MRDRNLSGLSPVWLISLAMALGTGIIVLIPAAIAEGEAIKPSSWIGFAGSVLGACLTILGFFLAANNIRRQLRINLISREEGRIEEQLPGLEEIAKLLDKITPKIKSDDTTATMNALGIVRSYIDLSELDLDIRKYHQAHGTRPPGPITDESVKEQVPQADDVTRKRLLARLEDVWSTAVGLNEKKKNSAVDQLEPERSQFIAAISRLSEFQESNKKKVNTYQTRLVKFREEIEGFFEK
jgi:hypothetical protein